MKVQTECPRVQRRQQDIEIAEQQRGERSFISFLSPGRKYRPDQRAASSLWEWGEGVCEKC